MGRRLRLPAALRKAGGVWPTRWGSGSLARVSMADKAEEAIRHLAKTPQGAFWADLSYGSKFHLILTQGLPLEGIQEDGPIPTSLEAANTEFMSAVAQYVPDATILGTSIEILPANKSVVFNHSWRYNGDDAGANGVGNGSKERVVTTVI